MSDSHIFISYSCTERDYVRELVRRLKLAGRDVWFDDSLEPGEPFPLALQEKVETARVVLVVVTQAAMKSKWVQREVATADEKDVTLLPLVLEQEAGTLIQLKGLQRIDAFDRSYPIDRITQAVPLYTERDSAQPNNLPQVSLLDRFKGREAFLLTLRDALAGSSSNEHGGAAAITAARAVHGMGGVGKTRAAIEFAWRHQADYSALQATNRLAEAEPLMRRVVEIFRAFGEATGHEHPHMQLVTENYAHLLTAIENQSQ